MKIKKFQGVDVDYKQVVLKYLESTKNVFLTGGAGVGKTTLTQEIIRYYESEAKKVAKLASTGMAATLIGGQTLHSFFDLGIFESIEDLELNAKLTLKKRTKKLIASMSLIVIDEISMVSKNLFEMILLRLEQADYRGVVLVVGDFLQLPPVVRGVKEVAFAFESLAWSTFAFERVELTHIYRTDDLAFIELLHKIRFGFVDESVHNRLNTFIKPLPNEYKNFTFLFGKNISANRHNKRELDSIEGELFVKNVEVMKHIKSVQERDVLRFMADARVESELSLKIGAPVLFTRNAWNYFNGERGEVVNVDTTSVYIKKADGKVIKLEQVAQSKTKWVEKSVKGKKELVEEALFTLYQFPIKLAFGITIHKSQGMSIADLIIETNEIFAPSQFYVALSRSSNPLNLNLIAPKRQWYDLAFVNEKALKFVREPLSNK